MNISELPVGRKPVPEELPHFPALWLAVLWRNWGLLPAERLAGVLKTSAEKLRTAAGILGLDPEKEADPLWLEHGYITVIRSNWHLLPYEQLLELLNWAPERLAHSLAEEDFLWLKLGSGKPECSPVYWSEPTAGELKKMQQIGAWLKQHFPDGIPERQEKAFSFLHDLPVHRPVVCREEFTFSFIAPYSAGCGDIFNEDDPLPDILLERYAAMGIQGIWIHAVLYHLVPIPALKNFQKTGRNAGKNCGIWLINAGNTV